MGQYCTLYNDISGKILRPIFRIQQGNS